MATIQEIKVAKSIGKRLRQSRENGGFNLAILASNLNMSVLGIVSIEDGNILSFEKSLSKYIRVANLYAKEIDADISDLCATTLTRIRETTAREWDILIPNFLKKRA